MTIEELARELIHEFPLWEAEAAQMAQQEQNAKAGDDQMMFLAMKWIKENFVD